MANQWYPLGLQHFAQGDIAFLTDTIKIALVAQPYTFHSTDQFVSDLVGGSPATSQIVARSSALGTKTTTDGVLNAAGPTLSAVSGVPVYYVVLYKDTGSDATSPLLVFWDTGTGLPLTPNGGDIIVSFDSGPNKIAAL
jgi:hypothetical protein